MTRFSRFSPAPASVVLTVVLLAVPLAAAVPAGPSYPPPGGVTLTQSGNVGRAGGLTWSYANLDMNRFNGLWWGPWDGASFQLALDGTVDAPGEYLSFSAASSDFANGLARWTGSSALRVFVNGAYRTETLPTRLSINGLRLDGTPLAFLDPASAGLDAALGAVLPVPGDYRARLLLEAQRSNVWEPVLDLYDRLNTDPAAAGVKISLSAGFYSDLNLPPVAGFAWSPTTPIEGQTVTFTSASSDPEGRPFAEAWDLDGDGVYGDASGPVAARSFAARGNYTVGLQITDDRGLVATLVRQVNIVQPPVANFSWSPSPAVERQEVTFSSSSFDPEGRPLFEAWDLDGDGVYGDVTGPVAKRTFDLPGTYTVGLEVRTDRGLVATQVQQVTVVDCARGPVSNVLRNTVYPQSFGARNTIFFLACSLADDGL